MQSIKRLTLCFVLGLFIISCQNKNGTKPSIAGKWTFETISPKDSSEKMGIALLALILAKQDIDHLEFTPAGQFKVKNSQDSVLSSSRYEISKDRKELTIKENGEGKSGKIISLSDKKLKLMSDDGTKIILKRKE